MKKIICVVGVIMMLISGCGNRDIIDINYPELFTTLPRMWLKAT